MVKLTMLNGVNKGRIFPKVTLGPRLKGGKEASCADTEESVLGRGPTKVKSPR